LRAGPKLPLARRPPIHKDGFIRSLDQGDLWSGTHQKTVANACKARRRVITNHALNFTFSPPARALPGAAGKQKPHVNLEWLLEGKGGGFKTGPVPIPEACRQRLASHRWRLKGNTVMLR